MICILKGHSNYHFREVLWGFVFDSGIWAVTVLIRMQLSEAQWGISYQECWPSLSSKAGSKKSDHLKTGQYAGWLNPPSRARHLKAPCSTCWACMHFMYYIKWNDRVLMEVPLLLSTLEPMLRRIPEFHYTNIKAWGDVERVGSVEPAGAASWVNLDCDWFKEAAWNQTSSMFLVDIVKKIAVAAG